MTHQPRSTADTIRYAETHMRIETIGQPKTQARIEQQPHRAADAHEQAPAAEMAGNDAERPARNAEVDPVAERKSSQAHARSQSTRQKRNAQHHPQLREEAPTFAAQGVPLRNQPAQAAQNAPQLPQRPAQISRPYREIPAQSPRATTAGTPEITRNSAEIAAVHATLARTYVSPPAHIPTINHPQQPDHTNAPASPPHTGKASTSTAYTAPEIDPQSSTAIWPFALHSLHDRLDDEDAELLANQHRTRNTRIQTRR